MSLHQILRAGRVTRWHSNPDLAHIRETNAEHQWMVAMILHDIWPGHSPLPPALVRAALVHDLGEVIGDLPGPFKAARPDIAALHADAEAQARTDMGAGFWLTEEEARWLMLADRLAAWVHVAHHRRWLLRHDGWPEVEAWIIDAARALTCLDPVCDLLRAMGWREAAE